MHRLNQLWWRDLAIGPIGSLHVRRCYCSVVIGEVFGEDTQLDKISTLLTVPSDK